MTSSPRLAASTGTSPNGPNDAASSIRSTAASRAACRLARAASAACSSSSLLAGVDSSMAICTSSSVVCRCRSGGRSASPPATFWKKPNIIAGSGVVQSRRGGQKLGAWAS